MDGLKTKPLPESDLIHVLNEAGGVWESLRGQHLFMTGATGFVGRWLLESLLKADETFGLDVSIVALSREPHRFLTSAPHLADRPKLSWVRGSVATLVPEDLDSRRFDSVIHLATEADLEATRADPAAARQVIAGGTRRTLEVATRSGARRVLFTSSGSVYGPQAEGVAQLSEEMPLPVEAPDGMDAGAIGADAKRQAERYCAEFSGNRGKSAVVARCFTFAGPALPLDGKYAYGNFIRDAMAGMPIVVTGDGSPVRSYMYGADLAIWLWTLLARGAGGGVYNVGSEEAICLQDLARKIAHKLGSPGVEIRQRPNPGIPVNRYVPSTEKARSAFGLRETIGLGESIMRTARWLLH